MLEVAFEYTDEGRNMQQYLPLQRSDTPNIVAPQLFSMIGGIYSGTNIREGACMKIYFSEKETVLPK